jgi:putative transposase
MVWQPQHWTSVQLEERRLAAARLLRAGKLSQAEIARHIGVSRAAVTHWKQRLEQQRLRGLRRHPSPGRPSHLTAAQWRQLLRLLARGAGAAGFDTERWTLRRIAAVIQRRFGVRYHFRWLGAALRARGWSPQQPLPRARERDEALVAAWLRREWPRVNRGLAAAGAPWSSWTRRVTRFGPAAAPPGRPAATRPSCDG